jgi:hypothetical protein
LSGRLPDESQLTGQAFQRWIGTSIGNSNTKKKSKDTEKGRIFNETGLPFLVLLIIFDHRSLGFGIGLGKLW